MHERRLDSSRPRRNMEVGGGMRVLIRSRDHRDVILELSIVCVRRADPCVAHRKQESKPLQHASPTSKTENEVVLKFVLT